VPNFPDNRGRVALAICYEISVPQHARAARSAGAAVYLASVAKSGAGIAPAHERLAGVARAHGLMVLMANCVGVCDGVACAGRSAAWDAAGARLAQLDDRGEAVLVLDTSTRQATRRALGARAGRAREASCRYIAPTRFMNTPRWS
jgi:predicted amidohydrolase